MRFYILFILFVSIGYGFSVADRIPTGGGKAAFKNYFIGSHHFSEGRYRQAEDFLARAYEQDPRQYNFALAYALALGRMEKTFEAEHTLEKAKALLQLAHPSYKHQLCLLHFVDGMINLYAARYNAAILPLQHAVQLQDELPLPAERSIMLNALGYAHFMAKHGSAGHHSGLGNHFHVDRYDLERSFPVFKAAYTADVQNTHARDNYVLVRDTLHLPIETIVETPAPKKERFVVSAAYTHLPAYMEGLEAFLQYDEVVLLLDISGSMVMEQVSCVVSDRFKVMRETALLLLDNLPDSTRLGIGTIGGDCGTTPRLWHKTGELSMTDFRFTLEFLVPDGTTPLLTILQETPSLFSEDPNTSKAILFISDGENVCRVPGVDICEWAAQLPGITINVMTFLGTSLDNSNAFAEYSCLAENTFGQVLYLDGNRCRLEHYRFDLVKACHFSLPPLERVQCWGDAVKDLWAVFPEK